MKKVLIISESSVYIDETFSFISRGGGASCVHNIAKSLVSSGMEVDVVALREFLEQKADEIIDGVHYIREVASSRSSFKLFEYLKNVYLRRQNYDVVFFNQFIPHLLLPFIRKKQKIAIVHDVYLNKKSFWFKQFGIVKGGIGYLVEGLQLLFDKIFADKIMTVSSSSKDKISKFTGKKILKKIVVIPNSIDLKKYSNSYDKENYLLFVGRFVSYKRPWDLLYVMDKIRQSHPGLKAKFVLTRDFPEIRERFLSVAKKLNLSDFELLNRVSSDELRSIFSKAKVLVHPSEMEGQGIVVLEALASGTPVCAYNLKAYEGMLVNGQNCELADCFDVDKLADATVKILNNFSHYQSKTNLSLDNFSEEVFLKKILNLLES